ncbi:MAG TPA: hypothetical protein VFZ61_00140, partial [Polyangiales bacterium]
PDRVGADAAIDAPSRLQQEAAQPGRATSVAPTGVRGAAREPGMDVDLRALPRGERRPLDLDNPFR